MDRWQTRAYCAGADPDLFYVKVPYGRKKALPERTPTREELEDVIIADWCAHCPVRSECLDSVVDFTARTGASTGNGNVPVAGGLHSSEVRALIVAKKKARAAS